MVLHPFHKYFDSSFNCNFFTFSFIKNLIISVIHWLNNQILYASFHVKYFSIILKLFFTTTYSDKKILFRKFYSYLCLNSQLCIIDELVSFLYSLVFCDALWKRGTWKYIIYFLVNKNTDIFYCLLENSLFICSA